MNGGSGKARTAVILARGLGTRMRERDDAAALDPAQQAAAETGVKAMISFGPHLFLDYVLSSLADAGIAEACLVIGPEHGALRDHYARESPPRRLRIAFAVQEKPLGTADAVLAAQPFARGDDFLAVNSDNVYPVSALSALAALSAGSGVALFERDALVARSNIPAERIASFAVCRVTPEGDLAQILEKPDAATLASFGENALVSMNCWRFSPAIFDACRRVEPSPRGELELPAAVALAIASGERFRVVRSREGVLDLSRRADIGSVAERLSGIPVEL